MNKEQIICEEPLSFVFKCPECHKMVDITEEEDNHPIIEMILRTLERVFKNEQ